MAGAIRYITNKPDVNAFSAGVDFDGGQIQGGQQNWTYEGFLNVPLIYGVLGLRVSAFSDSHGGFIDNQLTTRTWVNGAVSDNSAWARNDYNRAHVEGGRVALQGGPQRALERLAHLQLPAPEHPRRLGRGSRRWRRARCSASVPRATDFQAKMLDFHLDGRRRHRRSGLREHLLVAADAPAERVFAVHARTTTGGAQEGFTCLNDPVYGTGPYTRLQRAHRSSTSTTPIRNAGRTSCGWHPSPAAASTGWPALYWEKTRDKNSGSTYYMPGLQHQRRGVRILQLLHGTHPSSTSLPPGQWYAYTTRSDYLQTTEFANISFDLTDKLNVEAGTVHFHSDFRYYSPYGQFAYAPTTPSPD